MDVFPMLVPNKSAKVSRWGLCGSYGIQKMGNSKQKAGYLPSSTASQWINQPFLVFIRRYPWWSICTERKGSLELGLILGGELLLLAVPCQMHWILGGIRTTRRSSACQWYFGSSSKILKCMSLQCFHLLNKLAPEVKRTSLQNFRISTIGKISCWVRSLHSEHTVVRIRIHTDTNAQVQWER